MSVSSSARKTRATGWRRFIRGARRQLLIYDPQLTDDAMLQILVAKAKAGVDVRSHRQGRANGISRARSWAAALHVRAIIRDGSRAFIGSQSLRKLELEKRREVGVIVDDRRSSVR